jgi:acyl phosphate:glycerol-3-phosphate acyltransferase
VQFIYLITGFILAYLLGSIPTAVWVGRLFYGIDVRNEGSGNAGATNTIRVLGVKAGIPVIIIDILKGYFAVILIRYLMTGYFDEVSLIYVEIAAGLLAVVGHTLPVFAGFRGGKGVATLLGAGIALYGWAVIISVLVFLVVFIVGRYVSLASITAGIVFPIVVIWIYRISHPGLVGLAVFAAVFLLWTHRKNISRLMKGEENRFRFRKEKAEERNA